MTNQYKLTQKPRIKWGILYVEIATVLVELGLVVLNQLGATGHLANANVGLGLLSAYGWIAGLLAVAAVTVGLLEDFIPSYKAHKQWEADYSAYRAERRARSERYEAFVENFFED